MKRIYLSIIIILLATSGIFAQQLPLYSQYMLNRFLLNPGVTGSSEAIELRLTARQQWVGIENAPSTQMLSGHLLLKNGTMGVGGLVFADRFGPESRIGFQGNYSYILPVFNDESKLAFGLSFQVFQYQMNYANLTYLDVDDPELNYNRENAWLPESDFGMYLYGKKYYAGISANQLIELPVKIGEEYLDMNTLARHYHLIGGYLFYINEDFSLEPSALLKSSFKAPFQADINLKAAYLKDYWLGFSYRSSGDVIAMLGVRYKEFILGFAFDYATSRLSNYQNGTFELMLGYDIYRDNGTGRSRF
jgi:type IX secretion system PorP/SprF family membrane protein